jgi:hypothetical protein
MTLGITTKRKTEFPITIKRDTRHETQENGIQHYNKNSTLSRTLTLMTQSITKFRITFKKLFTQHQWQSS